MLAFSSSAVRPGIASRARAGRLCRQAPKPRACRRPLLGLRAQLNPQLPPEEASIEDEGGINWDAINVQFQLFSKMALPYFKEEKSARMLLGIVIGFTLLNSWVSVGFSFLSRDFWSALNTKDTGVCACMCMCVCECVCERERETESQRERERGSEKERERERKRERQKEREREREKERERERQIHDTTSIVFSSPVYVCVFLCVYLCMHVCVCVCAFVCV